MECSLEMIMLGLKEFTTTTKIFWLVVVGEGVCGVVVAPWLGIRNRGPKFIE